jgi:hypothetical protein
MIKILIKMKSTINFLFVILLTHFPENEGKKPNIVIIVADDMVSGTVIYR